MLFVLEALVEVSGAGLSLFVPTNPGSNSIGFGGFLFQFFELSGEVSYSVCVGGGEGLKFFDTVSEIDDAISAFFGLRFSYFSTGYSNLGFKVIPG